MTIRFEVDDNGIALITLDRPDRLNALDAEHYELLSKAWMRVRDDIAIRVAVISGAGERAFCVGADIKSFLTRQPEWAETWVTQQGQLLNRGLEVWKPVIAAVNGFCLGGGLTLLLATDIRIAGSGATFGLSEVKRGIVAGNGGTQRIAAQLPYPIAMELLLTGDPIDAEMAGKWGLVNKVVAPDQVMATAMAYARKVAANAPLAVQASKELAIRSRDYDLSTGLRIEQIVNRILRETRDAEEGSAAFSAKRQPQFQGR